MTIENETITPKANRRVIDAELVEDKTQASSATFGKYQGTKAREIEREAPVKGWTSWLSRKFLAYLLLTISLLVVMGFMIYLLIKQQDQNNQMNQLHAQVAQLTTEQARLEQVLQVQKETAQALEKRPFVSQTDVATLKQGLATVESQVIDITQTVQKQLKTWLELSNKTLENWLTDLNGQRQQSTPANDNEATPAANVQNRLQNMAEQLQELLLFKEAQLVTPKPEITPQPMQHLSETQMQQWILEANTQWLLEGNIAKTQQQLQAIEQAASLSEFAQQTLLMRLIGEDMVFLKALETQAQTMTLPNSTALKNWLRQQVQHNVAKVPNAVNAVAENTAIDSSSLSVWQRLQQGFGSVFTVKKRDSEQDLSRVEQTLMQEVILQRSYLWVEQLDWSMQRASTSQRTQTLQQLNAFVADYWPHAKTVELERLLKPYAEFVFDMPQPLNVVNAL